MILPEDIVYDSILEEWWIGDDPQVAAEEAVRALRLAGWIRSIDERNTVLGID